MPKTIGKERKTNQTRPALNPDDRENQIIAEAMNLAEKQIREGTASSQVIAHFLKLGSSNARYEKEKLKNENELMKAKRLTLESQRNSEAKYAEAIAAMKAYSGNEQDDFYDDEDDGYY